MIRLTFLFLLPLFAVQGAQPPPKEKPPTLEQVNEELLAKGALLVDPLTGQVLYARNIDDTFPPASTVKLMTAWLVYQKTGGQGTVTIRDEDTHVEPSSVPLRPGERVPISELLHSILIGSDNDSAMALARTVAGSEDRFIDEMNQEAMRMGMTRTRFSNPHGLPGPGQRTTARDLMVLFDAVLSKPELRQIAQTPVYFLRTAIGLQRMRNHNKLLGVYPGMGPAKTGWTYEARHTFAAAASRNGRELRLTLLKSANKWKDTRLLFDYGFANLPPALTPTVASKLLAASPAAAEPSPTQTTNKDVIIQPEPVSYTIRKGDSLTGIARRYRVGVEDILLINPMDDPDFLVPGQVLRIPQKSKTP
ncbi:MAG: LysM peptidoglycan-binding domain-containing protein [Verrucomicrobia bacterium]|nr:LysM peptidoglycan-binding domain-containing protein [Verrucomicrobiota bacterium]NDD81161.1 LysM peptidoglycan-binding domain-containing protein [Verrucomicrobiota bacterium]